MEHPKSPMRRNLSCEQDTVEVNLFWQCGSQACLTADSATSVVIMALQDWQGMIPLRTEDLPGRFLHTHAPRARHGTPFAQQSLGVLGDTGGILRELNLRSTGPTICRFRGQSGCSQETAKRSHSLNQSSDLLVSFASHIQFLAKSTAVIKESLRHPLSPKRIPDVSLPLKGCEGVSFPNPPS